MNELIKTRTKNIPYDRVRELNKIMNCWLKYILIYSREVSVWNDWESEIMFNPNILGHPVIYFRNIPPIMFIHKVHFLH